MNTAFAGELEDVKKWVYSTPTGSDCDQDPDFWIANEPAKKIEIEYTTEWSTDPQSYTMFEVACYGGAYNFSYIYIEKNQYLPEGYRVLSFAQPVVDFEMEQVYSTELEMEVDVIKSWSLTGFSTTDVLVNSFFKENDTVLKTFYKGRGIGDAFEANTYTFKNGAWVITSSEVDPTFDGEINPVQVFGQKIN